MGSAQRNSPLDLCDFLSLVVTRDEVNRQDIQPALSVLRTILKNAETISRFKERIALGFFGYEHDTRELWEIPEVRNYIYTLDKEFPYWLFFLSKHDGGLAVVIQCFLSPDLTESAKARIHPEELQNYLLNRAFPAMNDMCEIVGMSLAENEELSNRVVEYVAKGPAPVQP